MRCLSHRAYSRVQTKRLHTHTHTVSHIHTIIYLRVIVGQAYKEAYVMYCNVVKLRKLLSAHKSYVRETSLFTGAILNPIRNSQTSRFVSVPGQNPGRLRRGNSVVLRLQSVMMADVRWCRSGTGILYLKEFCFQS